MKSTSMLFVALLLAAFSLADAFSGMEVSKTGFTSAAPFAAATAARDSLAQVSSVHNAKTAGLGLFMTLAGVGTIAYGIYHTTETFDPLGGGASLGIVIISGGVYLAAIGLYALSVAAPKSAHDITEHILTAKRGSTTASPFRPSLWPTVLPVDGGRSSMRLLPGLEVRVMW